MTTAVKSDRRFEPRASHLGTAVVHVNRWWTHEYRVEDLSAGGALLTDGPPLEIGHTVGLVLRLRGLETLWVDARVLRRLHGPGGGVAVAFVDLEAAVEDLIHDVVVAALSGRRLRPLPTDHAVDWAPNEPQAHGWLN